MNKYNQNKETGDNEIVDEDVHEENKEMARG